MSKFFDRSTTPNTARTYSAEQISPGKTVDTNPTSMLGTVWTVSTSAIAGITESVITPGLRLLNFVSEIMMFYKKLVHNFTTISSKVERITSVLYSLQTGNNIEHVRNSVIKYKVKSKKR